MQHRRRNIAIALGCAAAAAGTALAAGKAAQEPLRERGATSC